MLMQFDTDDEAAAVGALLVYAVWRSRDRGRLKVTPDLWSQIERFVKASAKRSQSLPEFLEALKPRIGCGALQPRWLGDGTVTTSRVALFAADTGALESVMELNGARDGPLADCLNGTFIGEIEIDGLWIVMEDADRLDSLGEKWGIDAVGLAACFKAMTFGQRMAIVEEVERRWRAFQELATLAS